MVRPPGRLRTDTWCVKYRGYATISALCREEACMSLRDYIHRLEERGDLIRVSAPISTTYEIAGVLKQLEPKPVLFECVKESPFRVMGNLFCDKASFAAYFGIQVNAIIPFLARAIDQRRPGDII